MGGGERIDAAFVPPETTGALLEANVDAQCLAFPMHVPKIDLAVQPSTGHPVGVLVRRGEHLDIVVVEANRLGRILSRRPPYLDADIRRGRDEGLVRLYEDNVVDPVGMRLDLVAESGCWRSGRFLTLAGRCRPRGIVQVKIEIPGADDSVAPSRVAVQNVSMPSSSS